MVKMNAFFLSSSTKNARFLGADLLFKQQVDTYSTNKWWKKLNDLAF